MITLKEIAQMCGVSISTVSNTINGKPNVGEETRRKVLEVIERTGYKPNYFAQGMKAENADCRNNCGRFDRVRHNPYSQRNHGVP